MTPSKDSDIDVGILEEWYGSLDGQNISWSGHSTIFKLSWYIYQKYISLVELVTVSQFLSFKCHASIKSPRLDS